METIIISDGWEKIDLNEIKTINFRTKDFNWIFELLGWNESGRQKQK